MQKIFLWVRYIARGNQTRKFTLRAEFCGFDETSPDTALTTSTVTAKFSFLAFKMAKINGKLPLFQYFSELDKRERNFSTVDKASNEHSCTGHCTDTTNAKMWEGVCDDGIEYRVIGIFESS